MWLTRAVTTFTWLWPKLFPLVNEIVYIAMAQVLSSLIFNAHSSTAPPQRF